MMPRFAPGDRFMIRNPRGRILRVAKNGTVSGVTDDGLNFGYESPNLLDPESPPAPPAPPEPLPNPLVIRSQSEMTGAGSMVVTLPFEDRYTLWGYVLAVDDAHDSWFVQVDEGTPRVWFTEQHSPAYQWVNLLDGGSITLTAGMHTITLRDREPGTGLRELILVNRLDWTPTAEDIPTEPLPEPFPEPPVPPSPPQPQPLPPPPGGGSGPVGRLWGPETVARLTALWQQAAWRQAIQAITSRPVSQHQGDHQTVAQYEACQYASTNDPDMIERAWAVLEAYFGDTPPSANAVRERGPDIGWVYALLRPGLSTARRQEVVRRLNGWIEHALQREAAGSMTFDTDQNIGSYAMIQLGMQATMADNPQANEYLLHPSVARWRKRIDGWLRDYAPGGIFVEGSAYSPGTLQLLVLAAAGMPEWTGLRSYCHDVARAAWWELTPDVRLPNEWGDIQSDFQGRVLLDRWLPLWTMLTSVGGDDATCLRQWIVDVRQIHSVVPEKHLMPRAMLLADLDGPRRDWRPQATGTFFASGQGILICRT